MIVAGVCLGLGLAGLICLTVGCLVRSDLGSEYRPKQPEPERSFPTSQDLVIDNLRTMYLEGQIESDEFEARLWRAMTGADTPERIAEAEGIAASLPERDEVFRLMRDARDRELENQATPNRVIVENNRVKVLRGDK